MYGAGDNSKDRKDGKVNMTVSNETNRTSAVGTGAEQIVPFTFPITNNSDIVVTQRVTATAVETLLAETTNYTVTNNGESGGSITTVTPFVASTAEVHIVRDTPNTQELDLVQGGSFNAESLEDMGDKNTKLTIENANKLSRIPQFPTTDPSSSLGEYPNSVDRASLVAGWDSDGKPNAQSAVPTGSVSFSAIGTNIAEAADAATVRGLIGTVSDVIVFGAIGDGVTDDTVAIQAAFDVSGAKIVYFPPGFTFLVSGLTITTDDCTIEGYDSTLKLKVLDALDGSPIIDNQSSNLEIYGLRFDGQKDSQPADGFSDSLNTGSNSTGRAFRAAVLMDRNATAGLSGLLIKDCFFEDIYGACVTTNQISKVRILDCVAEDNFFELGFLYDLPVTGNNQDAIITGNRIDDAKSGHVSVNANGFTVSDYSHLIVADNQIRDVDRNFIKVEGGNHITITGNVGENNDDDKTFTFIQFQGDSTNVVVSNNTCKHFQKGIQFGGGDFSHIAIIGNVLVDIVDASTGDAIVADGDSFTNVIIANNILENVMRDGIHLKQCNRVTIANNLIYGHASNTVGVGIRIWLFGNAEDIVIRGNTMQNFTATVNIPIIYIIRDASETLTNLLIQGNIVKSDSSTNYAFRIPDSMVTTGIVSGNFFDGIVQSVSSSINWYDNIITGAVTQTLPTLANDATPSVASKSDVYLTGGTTTITDFDDGVTGQRISILAEHSVTITDGTNMFLNGSTDFDMLTKDTLTLIQKADGKWYETGRGYGGSDPLTITNTVELSSTNIKALSGTPITLVAAQGADTVIEFVSAVLIHDAGTAYVEPSAPDDMVIEYDTGTDVSGSIDATGFLTVTDDEIRIVPTTLALTVDLVPEKNAAIRLLNTGTNYTTGTGTMSVKTTYRVHTLGL